MITVNQVAFAVTTAFSADAEVAIPFDLGIEIAGDANLEAAPTVLVVSLSGGQPNAEIDFFIDNYLVYTDVTDDNGILDLTSVPVPDLRDPAGNVLMGAGDHLLSVSQSGAGVYDSTTFNLRLDPPNKPVAPGADAPPQSTAGAVQPDGARRWVLQDLMPGGLGSWVMPMNPETWDGPPFERQLTAQTTSVSVEYGGQYHIFESAPIPVTRTFGGYCPTQEMRDQLRAYGALRRRFYLIDHRGRAWVVTFANVELTPRLMQIWNGEWTAQGHDYKVTAVCYSREVVMV